MSQELLATGAVVLSVLGTAVLLFVIWHNRRRRGPRRRLDERLADAHPAGTHLDRPPTVGRFERAEDGTVAPAVEVVLGSTEPPGTELAFDYVASVLEAVHEPIAAKHPVDHYDVEFRFGPDGLFVSRTCARVAVPAEFADRLVADEHYRASDLHRDVRDGDDGDPEIPPVLWGDCRSR